MADDSVWDAVGQLDPTGVAPIAIAGTRLLFTLGRAVYKKLDTDGDVYDTRRSISSPGDSSNAYAQSDIDETPFSYVDTEAQTRAYETVNFVNRNFGYKIVESQIFSPIGLERALINANSYIEVALFSEEANRLFRSLAKRSKDDLLVISIFASMYLLGALISELSNSLPNYKAKYDSLGPKVVQQLFLAAIGQDAYAQNQVEVEKCFEVLASTAGLLRPTDISYATFPGIPNFYPSRYSPLKNTSTNVKLYRDLIKHLEKHGFPQPIDRPDIGAITDWRFLSGTANTRQVEVEKADRHIGENFGKVLYWLVCAADRMPPGQAVIAYFEQHIALVRWMATKFNFKILEPGTELDFVSKKEHKKMDKKQKALLCSWVLIVPPLQRPAGPSASYSTGYVQPGPSNSTAQMSTMSSPNVSRTSTMASPITSSPRSPFGREPSMFDNRASIVNYNSPLDDQRGSVVDYNSTSHGRSDSIGMAEVDTGSKRVASYYSDPTKGFEALSLSSDWDKRPAPVDNTSLINESRPYSQMYPPQTNDPTTYSFPEHSEPQKYAFDPLQMSTIRPSDDSPYIPPPPPPSQPYNPSSSSLYAELPEETPNTFPQNSPPLTTTMPPPPPPAYTSPTSPLSPVSPSVRRKAPPMQRKKLVYGKALGSFEAQDEEELSFLEGNVLVIVDQNTGEDGWWKATFEGGDGRVGFVPGDHFELMVEGN